MASAQPDFSLLPPANPILGTINNNGEQLDFSAFEEFNSVGDMYFSSTCLRSFSLPPTTPENPLPNKMDRKLVSSVSRTGRHLQRYNNGCRQVVGCIPYRYRETKQSASVDGTITEELEVLVVSSQKGLAMMFPKGGWEHDESMEEAALRETIEEAGVVGSVGCQLGKWNFMSKSQGTNREGYMFSLLVENQLDTWPEMNLRRRMWMKAADAREVCQYTWMKEALDELVHQLLSSQQGNETITI